MNGSTLISTDRVAEEPRALASASTAGTTSPSPRSASSNTAKAISRARCSRTSSATCRARRPARTAVILLPEPGEFETAAGDDRARAQDQVVCYDAGNGSMAARLWWMLRWVGHDKVAVLDGGFAQWVKEARRITVEVPIFTPFNYPIKLRKDDDRGRGHGGEDLGKQLPARRARPGTLSRRARTDRSGRRDASPARRTALTPTTFQPRDLQVRRELNEGICHAAGQHQALEVIHYCGSGVAACHNLLAMEVAGLQGGRLYAGSWSEWSADPKRPQERANRAL